MSDIYPSRMGEYNDRGAQSPGEFIESLGHDLRGVFHPGTVVGLMKKEVKRQQGDPKQTLDEKDAKAIIAIAKAPHYYDYQGKYDLYLTVAPEGDRFTTEWQGHKLYLTAQAVTAFESNGLIDKNRSAFAAAALGNVELTQRFIGKDDASWKAGVDNWMSMDDTTAKNYLKIILSQRANNNNQGSVDEFKSRVIQENFEAAIRYDRLAVAKDLIAAGANPSAKLERTGLTAEQLALDYGHVDNAIALREITTNGKSNGINRSEQGGDSLLQVALGVYKNSVAEDKSPWGMGNTIEKLLNMGADPKELKPFKDILNRKAHGENVLSAYLWLDKQDVGTAKALLDAGATPYRKGVDEKEYDRQYQDLRQKHPDIAKLYDSYLSPTQIGSVKKSDVQQLPQTLSKTSSSVTPTPAPDASKSQTPLAPAPAPAAVAASAPVDHPAATATAQPLPKANDNAEAKKPLAETDTPSSFNISRPPTLKEMSEVGKAISKARGLQNSAVAKAIEEYLGQSDGDRKITETEESQAITRLVNAPVLNLSASDQAKVENLVKALAGAGLLDGAGAVQPGKKPAKSNER